MYPCNLEFGLSLRFSLLPCRRLPTSFLEENAVILLIQALSVDSPRLCLRGLMLLGACICRATISVLCFCVLTGSSLVQIAASEGLSEMVRLLIEGRADVRHAVPACLWFSDSLFRTDHIGVTALHAAVQVSWTFSYLSGKLAGYGLATSSLSCAVAHLLCMRGASKICVEVSFL